ncbi:MAG: addiction module protein [Verrucomicrobia bacterium]|nr:addiction module protein [Verrucomicrobiota bacterium]
MATLLPLDQMTLEDKLRAMEEIWDDLRLQEERLPVPEWHKKVLDERERLVREGKAHFTDWETAKKRITDRTS